MEFNCQLLQAIDNKKFFATQPAEFLEAIQQPNHPEHESMLEWVGVAFDPNAFLLSKVNQLLQQIVGDK